MQLVLDLGNTNLKAGIFTASGRKKSSVPAELVKPVFRLKEITSDSLGKILLKYPEIDSCILSSVIKYPATIDRFLANRLEYIRFDSQTPVPVKNRYGTPNTLGNDRLACATAAHSLFPGRASLAITLGTCITYDLVTSKGDYPGGAISPGMQMRFSALHTFTSQLPLIEYKGEPEIPLTGNDTKGSLLSGVIRGIVSEVEGNCALYRKKYPSLQVIISGGDMNYFVNRLNISIFAYPNLVIYGLQKILEFNVRKNF